MLPVMCHTLLYYIMMYPSLPFPTPIPLPLSFNLSLPFLPTSPYLTPPLATSLYISQPLSTSPHLSLNPLDSHPSLPNSNSRFHDNSIKYKLSVIILSSHHGIA